jgi:hypothetical protein
VAASAAADNWQDYLKRQDAKEGIERELETLDILLATRVSRTSITLEEYIQMRFIQGATLEAIRADLLKDLEEGGRIFGEFKRALEPTFEGSVSRFRDVGQLAETGIGDFRWSAVLINTCEDCLERHGQVKSWAEWEAEGLPRTGATRCRDNCKCVLLPAEATELEPVKRGK